MQKTGVEKYNVKIPDIDYFRQIIKCTFACPINTPAGKYVQEVGSGNYEVAYDLARKTNPFVYVCARVCAHPCEDACRRKIVDEPIAINALKRVATDHHNLGLGHDPTLKIPDTKRKEKVAVIGSGPAGFSCAHDLALLGYPVTIFESQSTPGGMLALGLPVYRLPRDILSMEIDSLISLGIKLRTNCAIGKDLTIKDLREQGYQAVFIAVGSHKSRDLEIEGSDLDGVLKGVEFLLNVNIGYKVNIGRKVCIIGGGNVAIDIARSVSRKNSLQIEDGSTTMDAARTALRLGAEEVHVACLESRKEMPAFQYEVDEAENEGIILHPSRGPKRILGKNGSAIGLETIDCASVFDEQGRFNPKFVEGTESVIPADTIIMAIGQKSDLSFIQSEDEIEITSQGTVKINSETLATTAPGIFAGGDIAFGPRIIVDAIADGQRAAKSIHFFLCGGRIQIKSKATMTPIKNHMMPAGYTVIPRQEMPTLSLAKRMGISEVQLGYSHEQSVREGQRCLKCDVNTIFSGEKCILCGGCVDICPENCLKMVSLNEITFDENLKKLVAVKLGMDWTSIEKMTEEEIRQSGTVMIKDEENCIRCGLCSKRCPTGAISMELFEYEEEFHEEKRENFSS